VTADSDQFEFWVAHDHPERPFDGGVFVCDCDGCRIAAETAAKFNPRFTFVIRSNLDRIGVTADHLIEVWQRDGCIEALLYLKDDWIRDVGASTCELPSNARWWSLTLEEQEGRQQGLRPSAPGTAAARCPDDPWTTR
jgi:hypothetical protein